MFLLAECWPSQAKEIPPVSLPAALLRSSLLHQRTEKLHRWWCWWRRHKSSADKAGVLSTDLPEDQDLTRRSIDEKQRCNSETSLVDTTSPWPATLRASEVAAASSRSRRPLRPTWQWRVRSLVELHWIGILPLEVALGETLLACILRIQAKEALSMYFCPPLGIKITDCEKQILHALTNSVAADTNMQCFFSLVILLHGEITEQIVLCRQKIWLIWLTSLPKPKWIITNSPAKESNSLIEKCLFLPHVAFSRSNHLRTYKVCLYARNW